MRVLGDGYFEDVYEDRPLYELRRRQVPVREAEWRRFEVGQTYRVEATRSGTVRSVELL